MALGMVVTIGVFATTAVFARERLLAYLQRTDHLRRHLGQTLEIASASAILIFGAWLLIRD
jgi:ABC-type nickel/cobalt efflux system permease component RcnA